MRLMITSHSRFYYVYVNLCPHLAQAGATVRKLEPAIVMQAAPCAEWYIALQPCSILFSGFLHSAAFILQAVCSQSISFRHSRHTPSPPLLCVGAIMHSGQLLSVCIVHRFTLSSTSLQMLDNSLLVHKIAIQGQSAITIVNKKTRQ